MIDVSKVAYNVYAVLQDGTRLNVTPAVTDLGWEEGEGELSARFSFTVANVDYNGNPLSSTIKPNTAIVVTASAGGDEQEVANGKVIEWNPLDGATTKDFSVVCYDDLYQPPKKPGRPLYQGRNRHKIRPERYLFRLGNPGRGVQRAG